MLLSSKWLQLKAKLLKSIFRLDFLQWIHMEPRQVPSLAQRQIQQAEEIVSKAEIASITEIVTSSNKGAMIVALDKAVKEEVEEIDLILMGVQMTVLVQIDLLLVLLKLWLVNTEAAEN